MVQGADKLLKLYYTWHRHDGLKNHSETLGACQLLTVQHEIQMKLCRQGSHTFHAGFYMHNLPSRCKALVHHTLHDCVNNPILQFASGYSMEICIQILMFFACQFLLGHHHQGCYLADRLSRCTLASDSTKIVLRTPRFRTIRTSRNEETLFNRISIRTKQPRRSSYSTLGT